VLPVDGAPLAEVGAASVAAALPAIAPISSSVLASDPDCRYSIASSAASWARCEEPPTASAATRTR